MYPEKLLLVGGVRRGVAELIGARRTLTLRLLADRNFETANHERFSRSPMTNMPSITIFTLVSNHRLKMATFLG